MVVGVQSKDTISVTDSVTDSVSLTKFTEPLLNTPQSITVVPQFVMKDEAVTTLRDALRNVPGISLAAGEAGAQGDNLTIRGFTARNDIFLDGIRDFGSYYRDSFNYEQVEALEGPAGVQFGRGSTGGVVNQESKVPRYRQFVNVQTLFGTDKTRRITADLNSRSSMHWAVRHFVSTDGPGEWRCGTGLRGDSSIRRCAVGIGRLEHQNAGDAELLTSARATRRTRAAVVQQHRRQGPIRHDYYGFPDENYLKTNDES